MSEQAQYRATPTPLAPKSTMRPHRSTGTGPKAVAPIGAAATRRPSPRRLRRLLIASDVCAIVVGYALAIGIQQLVNPVTGATLMT